MELQAIQDKIIVIRDQQVILDSDVAALYGIETKRINEAVRNNPDKFPKGYIVDLTASELQSLRTKISTLKTAARGQHTKYTPRAFSERGLYMLATILKSSVATQTTLGIIETFAKVRELSRTMDELTSAPDKPTQKSLMQKSGELVAELLDDSFQTTDTETMIEFNLSVLKVRHTVKRKKKE